MLERHLFDTVDTGNILNKKKFYLNCYYRFFKDRDDIADNLIKRFKGKPNHPI